MIAQTDTSCCTNIGNTLSIPVRINIPIFFPISINVPCYSTVAGFSIDIATCDSSTSLTDTVYSNKSYDPIYITPHQNGTATAVYSMFSDGRYSSGNVINVTISAGGNIVWPQQDKKDLFKAKIKKQLVPTIIGKHVELWEHRSPQEIRARTLLFDLIGEQEFKRYLKRGFIMVLGKSGTLYKVSGGSKTIISYVKNQHTKKFEPFESYCIQFKSYDLPFTDGVIMRKLLLENDEFALRKMSNVFKAFPTNNVLSQPTITPIRQAI